MIGLDPEDRERPGYDTEHTGPPRAPSRPPSREERSDDGLDDEDWEEDWLFL